MEPEQTDVVILAGGKGTRLRPLTAVFPKPLVPLGDKPIIDILLTRLSALGFRNITLCTGYLQELVMAVVGDGSKYGLSVRYCHEETPLGTAGPLMNVSELSETFMIMNGDLLTTLDLTKMLQHHHDQQAIATIAVFKRDIKIDFGVIENDGDGTFLDYCEKPEYHYDVSMGVNILNRSVLEHMTDGEYMDMPDLILRVRDSGGKVRCYKEDCFWLDIGRMDDYAMAQEHFTENEQMFLGAPHE